MRSESNQNQDRQNRKKKAEIHQEQRVEQIGTWNVVLSGSSTARKKLPRSSVTKKYRRRKKILFLRREEEEQQHKSRGLTLLHERGELLNGLLGGGRHCRRRWAWRGQKPGLFRLFFSSLFLPFLRHSPSCCVLVRYLTSHHTTKQRGCVVPWSSAPVARR